MSVLARALAYRDAISDPAVGNRAGLARRLGVSRAFVTQAMAVLETPDAVLEAMRRREVEGRPVTEGLWRRVRRMAEAEASAALLGERATHLRPRVRPAQASTREVALMT